MRMMSPWGPRLRYSPDGDAAGGGAEGGTTDDGKASDDAGAEKQTGGEGDKTKMVPIADVHKARERARTAERERDDLKRKLDEKEQSGLTEVEKLRKDLDGVQGRLADSQRREAISEAFADSITGLGDKLELTAESRKLLEKQAREHGPQDPEKAKAFVGDLVTAAARPKATTNPATGQARTSGTPSRTSGAGEQTDPTKLTGNELAKLQRENPDEYKRVMVARKAALNAPKK